MVFTCTKILILNGIQKHNVSCADLGFLVDLVTLIQMAVNLARFRNIIMRRSTFRKKPVLTNVDLLATVLKTTKFKQIFSPGNAL